MSIRVLIVDRHEILRAGIKSVCSDRDDISIIGEAGTLADACRVAGEVQADVAIVDPESGAGSFEEVRELRERHPSLKILVFTSNDGPDYAARILDAGASGYLIKAAGLEEIAVAIRSVHMGRVFISHSHPAGGIPKAHVEAPTAMTSIDPDPAHRVAQSQASTVPRPHLSGREQEVLLRLADGMTNKQVAEELFLSVKTVETYRSRIMKKHQLRDRAELVRFARRSSTLHPDSPS